MVIEQSCAERVRALASPEGNLAYQCDGEIRTADGELIGEPDTGFDPIAFHGQDLFLVADALTMALVDRSGTVPLPELPTRSVHAVRSVDDGFLVAHGTGPVTLSHVSPGGGVSRRGTFSFLDESKLGPAALQTESHNAVLDGQGRLWFMTRGADKVIIRSSIHGADVIIGAEANLGENSMDSFSHLITGAGGPGVEGR